MSSSFSAKKSSRRGWRQKAWSVGTFSAGRSIRLDPPKAWRGRLYGLEFQFWPDPAGDGVLLFGSLVAKRGHIDNLAQNIASKGTPTFSAGRYHIYQPGISIEEGKGLGELADSAAAGVAELFIAAA